MKHLTMICLSCCVLLAATSAFAAPTVLGPTGLLATPNTDTVGTANIQLGGWYVNDFANTATVNFGPLPMLEVTGSWVDPQVGTSEEIFSAKWRFKEDSFTKPSVAVGIIDITDRFDLTPYVVVQKGFHVGGNGLTVSAGYANSTMMLDGFFAGADLQLGGKYHVLAEYDSDDINAGVRVPISDRIEVTGGVVQDEFAASAMYRIR